MSHTQETSPTYSEVVFKLLFLAGWACLSLYAIGSFFFVNVHSPFEDWEIALLKAGLLFLSMAFLAHAINGESKKVCAFRVLIGLTLGILTFLLQPFFLMLSFILLMTLGFAI